MSIVFIITCLNLHHRHYYLFFLYFSDQQYIKYNELISSPCQHYVPQIIFYCWICQSFAQCTCNTLSPSQGLAQGHVREVKVFAAMQHSHLAGRAITTHHYRNGTELPPLIEDPTYDFNFQDFRKLPEEVTIMPVSSRPSISVLHLSQ